MGRPSKYTPEVIDLLCEKIATTSDGLKKICDSDESFPSFSTVFRWLNEEKEFQDKYARAREAQADLLSDEIVEISNTPVYGVKTVEKPTGVETTHGDMIDHRRLQVDARKWKASKLAPKKYGDKLDLTTLGDKITERRQMRLPDGTLIDL